jgi:hypothetical protein
MGKSQVTSKGKSRVFAVVFCLKIVFNLAVGFPFVDPHKRFPCCLPVQRTIKFAFSLFNKRSARGEEDAQGTDRQPDLTFPQHFWRINQKWEARSSPYFCTPHWTRCMCAHVCTHVCVCLYVCMMYLHMCVCAHVCMRA